MSVNKTREPYKKRTIKPLLYKQPSGTYINVLLIDSSLKDPQVFVKACNQDTFPIIYNSCSSSADLLTLLSSNFSNINRIAIACTYYKEKTFMDCKSFFSMVDFFTTVVQQFHVKNLDFLACNTLLDTGWVAFYASLIERSPGLIIGASDNPTGSLKYGGDWIMESTGQDIKAVYFNSSIEYYTHLLDDAPDYQTYRINLTLVFNEMSDIPNMNASTGPPLDPSIIVYILMTFDVVHAVNWDDLGTVPPWVSDFTLYVDNGGNLTTYGFETLVGIYFNFDAPINYGIPNIMPQLTDVNFFDAGGGMDPINYGGEWFGVLYVVSLGLELVMTDITRITPYSPICFPAGTPITTDQGFIPIDQINVAKHTIGMRPILAITQTISQKPYLVSLATGSIGFGVPSRETVMTPDHKVFVGEKVYKAWQLVGSNSGINKIPYNGISILYNVLMKRHGKISVNGLMCETLDPQNEIAKLYLEPFISIVDRVRMVEQITARNRCCIPTRDLSQPNRTRGFTIGYQEKYSANNHKHTRK